MIAAIHALLDRTSTLSVEVEPLDRLTSGDRVALVVREAVGREAERLEFHRVAVYPVRDRKIAEIDIFEANQYEVDEFFG